MSNTAIQNISFAGNTYADDDIWVKMEQEEVSETAENANLSDIFQMLGRSASGLTAFSYRPPGMSYVVYTHSLITVDIDFWVFPSDLDLAYSLSINQGTLSSKTYDEVEKVGNIVVPLSDQIQMPYLLNENASSLGWETPVYNSLGEVLDSVPLVIDGAYITFLEDVFGVIRARFFAKGYRYTATLTFPKSPDGRAQLRGLINNQSSFTSIVNIACTVICTFIDENGNTQEEVLELKIPSAVADLLAECPSTGEIVADPRPDVAEEDIPTYITTYYYSTCTGEIISTERS